MLIGREMKVFGHFVKERSGFDTIETKNGEGIDPKVK